MKVRLDFVTNSSSSSFIIVGLSDSERIKQLQVAENKKEIECDYGVDYGEVVNFYGYYHEPYYVGIDIENLIETMTLPQIKEYFKNLIKDKYNIEIHQSEIELQYGEVGE